MTGDEGRWYAEMCDYGTHQRSRQHRRVLLYSDQQRAPFYAYDLPFTQHMNDYVAEEGRQHTLPMRSIEIASRPYDALTR